VVACWARPPALMIPQLPQDVCPRSGVSRPINLLTMALQFAGPEIPEPPKFAGRLLPSGLPCRELASDPWSGIGGSDFPIFPLGRRHELGRFELQGPGARGTSTSVRPVSPAESSTPEYFSDGPARGGSSAAVPSTIPMETPAKSGPLIVNQPLRGQVLAPRRIPWGKRPGG